MAIFTALAGYLTTALIGIGLSATVAGAVSTIAIGAALLGIGALFAPKPPVMKTPQAQAVINQTIGPRIRGYGKALLGGTRAFFDSKDGRLYQIIMMHSGEIDEIESVRVGDRTVSINEFGDVTTSAFRWTIETGGGLGGVETETRAAIRINSYRGTNSQTANSMIMDAFPSVWTSAHRLRGIAYLAVRFRSPPQEDFQKIFPDGYNTPVRGLCKLSKIWDPRTNTTAWSDNAGLCILDYLTHDDGFRKSRSDIDLPSFEAFADLCDENVPKKGGGSEKRYRLWGVYQFTDEPESILAKMKSACDAELYQTAQGKIAIRGGKWEPPTVTITDQDILGHQLEQGNDKFAVYNELKIFYTSASHDYQTIEATAWVDQADQDDRGPIPAELDLDFVPSASQARRLAKIHRAKSNPLWKGRISTNLVGLNALGERTVRLVLPELQIDDAFYVGGFSIDAQGLARVDMEVLTISEAAYQWDPATEEGDNPAEPAVTAPDLELPIPENLTLSAIDSDTIEATVTSIDRDGLELDVQIRLGAGGTWQQMETEDNNASAIFEPAPGGEYQARARWLAPQNVVSDWSFPYAEIDTREPALAPVNIHAELQSDDETVKIEWRMPNSSANLLATVWRVAAGGEFDDAGVVSTGYGAPNANYSTNDVPGTGAWDYYLTAELNGNQSVPVGPAYVLAAPGALVSPSVVGGLGAATLSFSSPVGGTIDHVAVYRVPTGGVMNRVSHIIGSLPVAPSGSYSYTDGDNSRVNLLANPSFGSDVNWTKGTGWSISGGAAVKVPGTGSALTQTPASIVAGKVYRSAFTANVTTVGDHRFRFSGGTNVNGNLHTTSGRHLDRVTAVTGNTTYNLVAAAAFGGEIDDAVLFEETVSCAPQGVWDYYIEPLSASGDVGELAGPLTTTII